MARLLDGLWDVVPVSLLLLLAACSESTASVSSGEPQFAEEILNIGDFMVDASPDTSALAPDAATASEANGDGAVDTFAVDCPAKTRAAYQIFANRCVICHVSENLGHGGFGAVLSARSMIASGRVVPFAPEQSAVYLRVSSGDMPRVGMRLTPAEVDHIEAWIRCGAPLFEREKPGDAGGADDGGVDDAGADACPVAAE